MYVLLAFYLHALALAGELILLAGLEVASSGLLCAEGVNSPF